MQVEITLDSSKAAVYSVFLNGDLAVKQSRLGIALSDESYSFLKDLDFAEAAEKEVHDEYIAVSGKRKHCTYQAIEKTITNSGIDAGIAKFQQLRSDDYNKLLFSESDFNSLGYNFITRGKIDAAIEVLKMNIELNPQSANAYDSLGEAYMKNGDTELAIKNYKESLELNPNNTNAKDMLKKLEKNENR